MARGHLNSNPPVARGQACRRCGSDAWMSRSDGAWRCSVCARADNATRNRLRHPRDAMLAAARDRSRQHGVTATITRADIDAAWPADNRCPALGIPLSHSHGTGHASPNSPTLDRLDNSRGYEPGNIAVISYAANRAKGNLRATDLERIAAWMRQHGLN